MDLDGYGEHRFDRLRQWNDLGICHDDHRVVAGFFGIKSYRDNHGGKISFVKGLQVGILISLISAVCYAAAWELYYPRIGDEFMQKYTTYYLDKMKKEGASDAEIEKARTESEQFMEMYKNVFVRFAMSLMEILPVGVIVTLLSALLLRRREVLPA